MNFSKKQANFIFETKLILWTINFRWKIFRVYKDFKIFKEAGNFLTNFENYKWRFRISGRPETVSRRISSPRDIRWRLRPMVFLDFHYPCSTSDFRIDNFFYFNRFVMLNVLGARPFYFYFELSFSEILRL